MRRSRTDLVAVLVIVAGGVIGASLSFSFLGRSAAVDVPLARETADQRLADAVRRLEDHAAAMRRAMKRLTTLEVPEGYLSLSSIKFTARPRLLEVAETYLRLSDFRDEEQQRLPEVAETYVRLSDFRDEEQQRLP